MSDDSQAVAVATPPADIHPADAVVAGWEREACQPYGGAAVTGGVEICVVSSIISTTPSTRRSVGASGPPGRSQYFVSPPPLGAPRAESSLMRCMSMVEELVVPFHVALTLERTPM